jgi:aspartate aminotransferase
LFPSCAGLLGSVAPDGRRIDSSDELVMYLLDAEGLAVLQGSAYGVPPYFRMSFAASMAVLDEGCERLARACARLTK